MTIPPQQRLEAMGIALTHMLEQIGDHSVNTWHINCDDGPLAQLPDTTWTELAEAGLVQRRRVYGTQGPQYEFTHHGWAIAHEVTGLLNDDAFRARCETLVATIKGYVKGRNQHHDVPISHHKLIADTGLPMGWLFNVIKSGLLQEVFPTKKMNARWDEASKVFRVPPSFGMDILR